MAKGAGAHETYDRPDRVKLGSDRAFGFVFAVFFSIVGGLKLWAGHDLLWIGAWFTAAGIVLVLALAIPRALRPFNFLWFKFGLLLHSIVSPLVMAAMFFCVVTPTAWAMRAFGKRPLSLKFEPQAETYWIQREPPGPPPASMNHQF